MPTFKVYGARESDAQDVTIVVEVESPDEASAIARMRGVYPSRIVEVEREPAAPSTSAPPTPQRVITSDDSYLSRNRGCGDLILYGPIILLIMAIIIGAMVSVFGGL